MQFLCMVTASYTLGFLMTKNPWLVFRLKHKISKQKAFEFSFMEKMLIIQFHSMDKMLIIQFHIWKKCWFCYFHTYTFTLWNCMKEYDKHFFHIWKLYDKHFCQPGIYILVTDPKKFLKAPLAPRYNNIRGEREPKNAIFLVKIF